MEMPNKENQTNNLLKKGKIVIVKFTLRNQLIL